jgi:hypothetical protein
MAWNNSNNTEKREFKPAEPRILVNLGKIEAAIQKMSEAPQFDFTNIEKSLESINKSLARLAVIKTCEHIEHVGGQQCQGCAVKPLPVNQVSRK